jgi:hypothetical protein
MTSLNLKRIVAAGALSSALGLAALGLGSGTANADDDPGAPLLPGGTASSWQSYLPLLGSIGDFVDLQKLGVPPEVANYTNLGDLGSLGNGQWQNIIGLASG